jgi:predicted RNA binding protein YcfA (HicA-like mRNA interferase family)
VSKWSSTKAKQVLAALLRIGWSVKRQVGSHQLLERAGWPDYIFAFHDREEVGPKMLARIAKKTGLRPEDL